MYLKSRKWILVSGSSLGGDCPGAGGSTPLLKAESAACRPLERVWPLGRAHCQNLQHHLRQGCLLCLLCQRGVYAVYSAKGVYVYSVCLLHTPRSNLYLIIFECTDRTNLTYNARCLRMMVFSVKRLRKRSLNY